MAWRGWKAARSVATLTSSSSPASTPAGTDRIAPSSASIVFSATSGSLSGARKRAELGAIGEAREFDARRQRGQFGPELTIDEDDARRIDARQAGKQCAVAGERRHRLQERCIGHRTQAGVFPGLLATARCGARQSRTTERIGGGIALPRIAGQAIAQRRR